jgi:hypothetical protein
VSSLASFLTSSAAASTYALKTSLDTLQSGLSTYLKVADAASTYLAKTDAATTYSTPAAVADMLDGTYSTPQGTLDVIPRLLVNSSFQLVGSGMRLTYFTPYRTITVSNMTIFNTTAGSGQTLARLGIYLVTDSATTLVARTASDTTLCTVANSYNTRPLSAAGGFPASYTFQSGQRYAASLVFVGGTQPTLASCLPTLGIATPYLAGGATGQSDLPATVTTNSPGTVMLWFRFT